ncbi:MAG: glycosyltransferase family 4 protein [Bacteroidales bacterium]|jgi:glycosyltransferase involved in cell wall biosynthesis|nr:glycosyltransferase family 4 protein [Bacteroidales bacterium]
MKICLFNTIKPWGGGENWHFCTAKALQANDFEVIVAADKNGALWQHAIAEDLQVKHFAVANLSFFNPFKRRAIRNWFVREKFDAVIFNSPKELKVAVDAAVYAKISRIIYRRGSAIPIKNSLRNRRTFKKLTDIIANSEATKKTILQNNPNLFPANKIAVIYNGIDTHTFEQKERVQNPVPIIGNLGRCVHQKGQDMLLQAIFKLKQRGVACRCVIGGDGPLLSNLKAMAAQLDIADYVDFIGFVNDPKQFLQSIDIFVLPSRWEGFGYVIAEVMANAKPVVAFDISSNPELIEHQQTGILIPFADIDLLANTIETLVNNPTLRETFGQKGKEVAIQKFNNKQNENKLIDFLKTTPSHSF